MIFSSVQGCESNSYSISEEYVACGLFGVKSAPAVWAKATIVNMIINIWLTFPFVTLHGFIHMVDIIYYIRCSP